MLLLKKKKLENVDLLLDYIRDVVNGDKTNREGHANFFTWIMTPI